MDSTNTPQPTRYPILPRPPENICREIVKRALEQERENNCYASNKSSRKNGTRTRRHAGIYKKNGHVKTVNNANRKTQSQSKVTNRSNVRKEDNTNLLNDSTDPLPTPDRIREKIKQLKEEKALLQELYNRKKEQLRQEKWERRMNEL
ncbi:10019_t:CDS:2 [Paraglomus occultum]|uniref:10019_t:CDS:1 n=1 Tax=Paraglomus occultum TaxID=144539 RepID=A0A9N9CPR1_9GLOM|nr:10019_t:CDS:2 [Paraglomus occultum]